MRGQESVEYLISKIIRVETHVSLLKVEPRCLFDKSCLRIHKLFGTPSYDGVATYSFLRRIIYHKRDRDKSSADGYNVADG